MIEHICYLILLHHQDIVALAVYVHIFKYGRYIYIYPYVPLGG
jgi:hypothetical protein